MLGRRLVYLAALLGCLVFHWMYTQWLSWVLLTVVAALPWFSLLISLPAMLTLSVAAQGPGELPMGAMVPTALRQSCRYPEPAFRVKLRVNRSITGEHWKLVPGWPLPATHCGGLVVTPVRGRVYDYLGLWKLRFRRLQPLTVVVMPEAVPMPVPPDLERYLARAWQPKFGGGYAENHELRLYRPGDNLNQVHWKLTAKVGKLIIREPMIPVRGLMLLTMDVRGSAETLDLKFGHLRWLGEYLLEREVPFEIRALTARGVESAPVRDAHSLREGLRMLLQAGPAAGTDSLRDRPYQAAWRYHIGGEQDEA